MERLTVDAPETLWQDILILSDKYEWEIERFDGTVEGLYLNLQDVPCLSHTAHPRSMVKSAFQGTPRVVKGGKELLFKAIGPLKNQPVVWDLTAGLGRDARMIMDFGYTVKMFERHPLIFLLLYFSLPEERRSLLEFAPDWRQLAGLEPPDVIYFDPMYDNPPKKAAPGLESQWLRELVGMDADAVDVAGFCCQHARARVVIKRPKSAAELLPNPKNQFVGSSTRYDMYLTNSPKSIQINERG